MKNLTITEAGNDIVLRVELPEKIYNELLEYSNHNDTMIRSKQAKEILSNKGYFCKSDSTLWKVCLKYRISTEVRGNARMYNKMDLNKIPAR